MRTIAPGGAHFRRLRARDRSVVLAVLLCSATIGALGLSVRGVMAQTIFADGFESGDTSAWTRSSPPFASCPSGPLPGSGATWDLGPVPAGAFTQLACLEVSNDRPYMREELAASGIPIRRDADLVDLSGLVLVGPGNRRVAAQFEALSRWGGPLDEASLPVRWLRVALVSRVAAQDVSRYALRRYAVPPAAPADPYAVGVQAVGPDFEIDTGVATFVVDPASPALLDSIAVSLAADGSGRQAIYSHSAGAGPRLAFSPGGSPLTLDTGDPGEVVVDPGGFALLGAGPVEASVMLNGHFSDPGGASLCPHGTTYERFGFSAVFTFVRASRDVRMQFHVRNECGDDFDPTDDAITIDEASWVFPFTGIGSATIHYTAGGAIAGTMSGASAPVVVEQAMDRRDPWLGLGRAVVDAAVTESRQFLERPLVALAGPEVVVAASMPWMRFREPQALAVSGGSDLELRLVGEPVVVGEGKGIWGFAEVSLEPVSLLAGSVPDYLETERGRLRDELERGLLVRAGRDDLNAARLYPSLGVGGGSALETAYLDVVSTLHEQTVSDEPLVGQWHRAKTYGSQVWPDVQTDPFGFDFNTTPLDNSVSMNYWNPSGAELLEFLRAGDPAYAWDFALPQSWLQMYTAYLNVGEERHTIKNGFAVQSGGSGEGQWHRSGQGSDDYTYDMGQDEAYVVRPSPLHRRRFAEAGRTVIDRYDVPQAQQGGREDFVNRVDLTRQVIQHFELLADCAEFAAGQDGRDCHDKLMEVMGELAADNLSPGHLCQGDIPSVTDCWTPQQFMTNSLMAPFLHRLLLDYGHVGAFPGTAVRAALVGAARHFYDGIMKEADGTTPQVEGDTWPSLQHCTLGAGGLVASCVPGLDSDNRLYMWNHNKPHSAALVLMGHELDPNLGLCGPMKAALDHPAMVSFWYDQMMNQEGWVKGTAQMMQLAVFAVGLYDTCTDP